MQTPVVLEGMLNNRRFILNVKCLCTKASTTQPKKAEKMELFFEQEAIHKSNLRYDILTEEEKIIHNLHEDAVKRGYFTYYDPKTNERILTRLRHFLRGKCCGNACRHCVYNHDNVIDEYKLKIRKFNTSFWIYTEELKPVVFDDSCYFDGSNLRIRENKSLPSTTFEFANR